MNHKRSSGLYLLAFLLSVVLNTPIAYSADWNPLVDTGQSSCFDAEDHTLNPCPGMGDPFYGQDGNYQKVGPNLWDNNDETVSDFRTGLMWLRTSFVPFVDGTYIQHDWPEAIAYCEGLSHAGYTDWRLAENFELQSLVDFSRYDSAIRLPIVSKWPRLWSATPIASDPTKGWKLIGSTGRIWVDDNANKAATLCVRGEYQNPGSFVDNGNSVTDTTTFITWQKSDDGQVRTWKQALSYCADLTLDEESDWRLPDIRELSSLIDFSSYNPALNDSYFPTKMASHLYWSSTTSVVSYFNGAWVVNFTNGETRNEISKDLNYATRCIRGGLVEYFGLSVVLAGTGSGDVQGKTVPGGKSVIDCGPQCSDDLPDGEVVRLTATPEPGSSFVRWGGDFVSGEDCEGDSGVCTLQMLQDAVVVAYFMPHKQLTVTKDGLGEGIVVSSPPGILCGDTGIRPDCEQTYVFGQDVTLTATPAKGSYFWYWSGEGCSGNGECIVNMDRTRNVTATFAPNLVALNLLTTTKSGTGNGNITSIPEGIDCGDGDCAKSFPVGSEVTLTAISEPGSVFSGWKGFPCFGTSPTCVVTMDSAWTQDAQFTTDTTTPRRLTVTIQDDPLGHSGRVSSSPVGINCHTDPSPRPDCTEDYKYKTKVTLSATPNLDASFTGWSGACNGIGSCVVYMDTAQDVTANFGPASLNKLLTVTKDGGGLGTVTSSGTAGIDCGTDCSEVYPKDSAITLIATPATGRDFIGWSGGGCSGTGVCKITLTTNTTINATFENDPTMESVFEDGFEEK